MALLLSFLLFPAGTARSMPAAENAAIYGTVMLRNSSQPVYAATVTLLPQGRSVMTDRDGRYEFRDLPPGTYDVASHMHALTSQTKRVSLAPGQKLAVDFELSVIPMKYEVTVTSTGREMSAFDTFQSVSTVGSLQLGEQSAFGLGDVVATESGVHKRSFGPGSSRPVIRGFDGDRVLVLSDGLPTGTLSAQSGEHAEPVDSAHLDRIEIVKGPATLLYGSNAVGGVVNMVTEHHLLHETPHPGFRGQMTLVGGTNSNQAAAHLNAEYGYRNWLVWGSGSRQVAGDYFSPDGRVDHSKTRMTSGGAGFGWFGKKPFVSLDYAFNDGRFGVPFAGEFHHHGHEEHGEEGDEGAEEEEPSALVDETFTWQNIRLNTGVRGLQSFIEEIKLAASFSRWMHDELENDTVATAFDNKVVNLRATFTQRQRDSWSGTSGLQFFHRDYAAEGEEALSPPATGNGFAMFTLQELDLEAARLQFGARVDHTAYDPAGLPRRSYTGFSGAAGIHVPLAQQAALVANYTHSFRAPAIEELYNYGPHIGNLAFEIGDPDLKREASDGIDLSLRLHTSRVEAEASFYFYGIRDFVYLSLTGGTEHGLRVAEFAQADSRFLGGEASFSLALHRGVWLESGLDVVDARLTATGLSLPRIPPLRGKVGFDARWAGLRFRPELVLAAGQEDVYPTETRTPGYAVVNMTASYALTRSRLMHVLSAGVTNAADRVYRNHLSFIKDLAPEMGRAFRLTYGVRFF